MEGKNKGNRCAQYARGNFKNNSRTPGQLI